MYRPVGSSAAATAAAKSSGLTSRLGALTYTAVVLLGCIAAAALTLSIIAIVRVQTPATDAPSAATPQPATAPASVPVAPAPGASSSFGPYVLQWLPPGNTPPAPSLGVPGQFYLDNSTGVIYFKLGAIGGATANKAAHVPVPGNRYIKTVGDSRQLSNAVAHAVGGTWIVVQNGTVHGGDLTGTISNAIVQRIGGVQVSDLIQTVQFLTNAVTNGTFNVSGNGAGMSNARTFATYDNVTFPFNATLQGIPAVRLDGLTEPGTLRIDGGGVPATQARVAISGVLTVNNLPAVVSDPIEPFSNGYLALFRDSNGTALITRAMARINPDGTFVVPFIVTTTLNVAGQISASVVATNALTIGGVSAQTFVQQLIDSALAAYVPPATPSAAPVQSIDFSVLNASYVRRALNLNQASNYTLNLSFFADRNASIASPAGIRLGADLQSLLNVSSIYASDAIFVGGVARGDLFWDNATQATPGELVTVAAGDPTRRTLTGSGIAYNRTTQVLTGVRDLVFNGTIRINGDVAGNVRYDNGTAVAIEQVAVAADTTGKVLRYTPVRISASGAVTNVTLLVADVARLTGQNRTINQILADIELRLDAQGIVAGFNATRNRALAYWSTENGALLPGQKELRQTANITITADERITGVTSLDVTQFVSVDGLRVNVSGPASSTPQSLAVFADASGRVIASSSVASVNSTGLFLNGAPVGNVRGPLDTPPIAAGTVALLDATGRNLLTSPLRFVNGTLIGVNSAQIESLSVNGTDIFAYINALALQATAAASNFTGITASGAVQDNALMRWDGTSGLLAQSSPVVVSDLGDMTGVQSFAAQTANIATTLTAGTSISTPVILLDSALRIRRSGPGGTQFVFEVLPSSRANLAANDIEAANILASSVSASSLTASGLVLTPALNSLGTLSINAIGDVQFNNRSLFNIFNVTATHLTATTLRNPSGSLLIRPATGSFTSFDTSEIRDVSELRFSTATTPLNAPKLRLSGASEAGITTLAGNIIAYTAPVAFRHEWYASSTRLATLSASGLAVLPDTQTAGPVLSVGTRSNTPVLTGTPSGIDLTTSVAPLSGGGGLAEQKLLIYSRTNGDFGGFTFNADGHFISAMTGPVQFQWRWLHNGVSRMELSSSGSLNVALTVTSPAVVTNTIRAISGGVVSFDQNAVTNMRNLDVRSPASPATNFAYVRVQDDEGPSLAALESIGTLDASDIATQGAATGAVALSLGGRRSGTSWQAQTGNSFTQLMYQHNTQNFRIQSVRTLAGAPAIYFETRESLGYALLPRGVQIGSASGNAARHSITTTASTATGFGNTFSNTGDLLIHLPGASAMRVYPGNGVANTGDQLPLVVSAVGVRSPRFDDAETVFYEYPIPGVYGGGVTVTFHRVGRMLTMQFDGQISCVSGGGCSANYELDALCGVYHPQAGKYAFVAFGSFRVANVIITQAPTPGFCRFVVQNAVGTGFYATGEAVGPFSSLLLTHTIYV